jgi:hypothetical protein
MYPGFNDLVPRPFHSRTGADRQGVLFPILGPRCTDNQSYFATSCLDLSSGTSSCVVIDDFLLFSPPRGTSCSLGLVRLWRCRRRGLCTHLQPGFRRLVSNRWQADQCAILPFVRVHPAVLSRSMSSQISGAPSNR